MTWVKLDDGFYDNPKVLAAGFDGAGLYAMCIAYCGRHLTDGFVSEVWLKRLGARATLRQKLTASKLWIPVDGGFQIPDYTTHNSSKQEVERRRFADRVRKESVRNPRVRRKESRGRVDTEKELGSIPKGLAHVWQDNDDFTPLVPLVAVPRPAEAKGADG